jgi:hypothetical protein
VKPQTILTIIGVICFASSCVNAQAEPSPTTLPNFTLSHQTPTITNGNSNATGSDKYQYIARCVVVENQPSQDVHLSDELILHDLSADRSKRIVAMNMVDQSAKYLSISGKNLYSFRVSPNRKWLAYIAANPTDDADEALVLQNFYSNNVLEIPWKQEWDASGIDRWLNDTTLLIRLRDEISPKFGIALNPFTKVEKRIPVEFPDQQFESPDVRLSPAEYDSSLRYAIYPAAKEKNKEGVTRYGFALLDTKQNKEIGFFSSKTLLTFGSPQWSPAGENYIFPAMFDTSDSYAFELFIGTIRGDAQQVTNLSQEVDSFYISQLVWSPDNRYVAFILNDVDRLINKILFLDFANRTVLDSCIEVNYDNWAGAYSDINFPVWSPDGNYLAVENQSGYGKNEVILINIQTWKAWKILEDKRVLGWVSLRP